MLNVSTDPVTLYGGGEWEQIKDVFPLASGSKSLGATGGEETHKLTIEEMPKHSHSYRETIWVSQSGQVIPWGSEFNIFSSQTGQAGGDQPHNNMPPYRVFNFWVRVA